MMISSLWESYVNKDHWSEFQEEYCNFLFTWIVLDIQLCNFLTSRRSADLQTWGAILAIGSAGE